MKGYLNKSFSKKDLGEAAYTLSIKIYIDRWRRLIRFFNEYIPWQDFEVVQNGTVKEGVLSCVARCEVEQRLKTRPQQKIEREWRVISYASVIGSIKYAMLWTRSIVYPTLILAREYNSDLGVEHWTAVKIILSGIRICFSIMEVTKRFIVKGYVDASFWHWSRRL